MLNRLRKKIVSRVKLILNAKKFDALAVNIAAWKRPYFESFVSEKEIFYIPKNVSEPMLRRLVKYSGIKKIYAWGCLESGAVKEVLANMQDINLVRVEDGFIRSKGLGSEHTPPLSLCFDTRGIYFDATCESDLEYLLNTYDFDAHPELLARAKRCIQDIVEHDITKYNEKPTKRAKDIYGEKTKRRILVVGQVEDDQSIKYGCDRPINNNDTVRLAYQENPDAQIIYKIHPDVLVGKREGLSNPQEVSDICLIVSERMSLSDALIGVDHVYTITSLLGFESLLRNVKVTTLGCPFYSGWGLTDDRQPCLRRNRKLSLEKVFLASYLLYPRYKVHGAGFSDLEDAIKEIKRHS